MKKQKQPRQQTVIGIDLGDRKHAICVIGKGGEVTSEFSIPNQREDLERLALIYPKARVAMEVGTHSPWISRLLEERGMEVFVANSRKMRAIYENERKCDQRDAHMLAKIARLDPSLLAPVRHGSEASQKDLLPIKLRDALVRQRTAIISSIRASLKALGVRLALASTASFAQQARKTLQEEHTDLLGIIAPALSALEALGTQITAFDKAIDHIAAQRHPQGQKMRQISGVGPITSLAFVLFIEDPERFAEPRDVGAYLGLVPRRDQSGLADKQLPISKAGNSYLRCLLVQSAQYLLGHFGQDCDLRRYGLRLAARGGKAAKKKAVIAVARKLAVLMLTLWRKGSDYEPLRPERLVVQRRSEAKTTKPMRQAA
jgi:transposase